MAKKAIVSPGSMKRALTLAVDFEEASQQPYARLADNDETSDHGRAPGKTDEASTAPQKRVGGFFSLHTKARGATTWPMTANGNTSAVCSKGAARLTPQPCTPLVEKNRSPRNGWGLRNDKREPMGKPIVRGTRARLWTSLVHVIPLAFTAFLIYINYARWFWFDDQTVSVVSPASVIDSLQFVAKLHEMLVIASLSALTIKVFKRRLVGSHLSLGLLTGAYRVGDIPYVFSKPFWSALLASGIAIPMLLVGVNTIVATLVGPASAILVVPDQDRYPIPDAFPRMELPIYFNRSVDETWPRVVSASRLNQTGELAGCANFTGWFAYQCPGGGFPELWNYISAWRSGLNNRPSFQDPTGFVSRLLHIAPPMEYFLNDTVGWTATHSTTISMAAMLTIGRLLNSDYLNGAATISDLPQEYKLDKFRLTTSDSAIIYQPWVQTSCAPYSIGPNATRVAFNYADLECFGDADCEMAVSATPPGFDATFDPRNASHPLEYDAVFMAPDDDEVRPLLAVAKLPYVDGNETGQWVVACSMMAHWVPSALTVSPGERNLVETNVTYPGDVIRLDGPPAVGPAIRIQADWIRLLSPEVALAAAAGPNDITGKNTNTTTTTPTTTTQLKQLFSTMMTPLKPPQDPSASSSDVFFEPGSNLGAVSGDYSADLTPSDRTLVTVQAVFAAVLTEGLARVAVAGGAGTTFAVVARNATTVVTTDLAVQGTGGAGTTTYDWSNGTGVRVDADGSVHRLVGDDNGTLNTPQDLLGAFARLTTFDFAAERFGYGSGSGGSGSTVGFALGVMFIYVAIVGGYFFYVMVVSRVLSWDAGRAVPTIVGWDDLLDVVVLAWNSEPSRPLRGCSVGKKNRHVLKTAVGIRADGSGKVQLTTALEDRDMFRLRRGWQGYY